MYTNQQHDHGQFCGQNNRHDERYDHDRERSGTFTHRHRQRHKRRWVRAAQKALSFFLALILVFGAMPGGLTGGLFDTPVAEAQMSTGQRTQANFVAIASGSRHSVALDDQGRVFTWAAERWSLLGRNISNPGLAVQVTATEEPNVPTLPPIKKISASDPLTLALDINGEIWSWGDYTRGRLNVGRPLNGSDLNRAMLPKKVVMPNGVKAVDISAAINGGRFIGTDGSIYVWGSGNNDYPSGSGYILGNNAYTQLQTAAKLMYDNSGKALPTDFVKIVASDYGLHAAAMAMRSNGDIYTWAPESPASAGGSNARCL
jgi:alpha-tubulin suppressor-like RCC1 family protein